MATNRDQERDLTWASWFFTMTGVKTGVIAIAKVLLIKTVERLGHVGEVVTVADGYARNYLFPQRLGIEPTKHNMEQYAKERAAHEAELLKREEKALLVRDKLADQMLTFERKAHDDDRLYGSVRAEDIVIQIEELVGEHIESSRGTSIDVACRIIG